MSSTTAPKIFLFNGPPRSGKDTAAEHLAAKLGKLMKFAEPIKAAITAAFHGGNRVEFNWYDSPEQKDLPHEVYGGRTTREVQISFSEDWVKWGCNPKGNVRDEAAFGRILARSIDRVLAEKTLPFATPAFFVSDSGFRPEAEVLVQKYGAPNIFLVRIFRAGYDFKVDSRGYIELADLGVREWEVKNKDLHTYLAEVQAYCLQHIEG